MNQQHAMQPRIQVQILGAGITGVSLASFLRARRVPFEIFDSASQPTGHNYGLTLAAWGYKDILPALSPELTGRQFRQSVAVDRKVGRDGVVSHSARAATKDEEKVRASDSSLRSLLTSNHSQHISWSHRLTAAEATDKGTQLSFQDGQTSTSQITVDASGDRSALLSLLIPNLTEPDILPYAVYHGTRFVRASNLDSDFAYLFSSTDGDDKCNTREWTVPYQPPYPDAAPTACYIQISKAYIGFADLPTPIQEHFSSSSSASKPDTKTPASTFIDPDQQNSRTVDQRNDAIFVEIRYTVSRPALTFANSQSTQGIREDEDRNSSAANNKKDPLYNPTRAKSAATTIPPEFYSELSTILSSPAAQTALPRSLHSSLLSPSSIKTNNDRLLNWLLRVRSHFRPETSLADLRRLADEQGILVVGDAAHNLPILGSAGASIGIVDAKAVADWIADHVGADEDRDARTEGRKGVNEMREPKRLSAFYEHSGALKRWEEAEATARAWLREVHWQQNDQSHRGLDTGGKL